MRSWSASPILARPTARENPPFSLLNRTFVRAAERFEQIGDGHDANETAVIDDGKTPNDVPAQEIRSPA